jgi:hypothetical protein
MKYPLLITYTFIFNILIIAYNKFLVSSVTLLYANYAIGVFYGAGLAIVYKKYYGGYINTMSVVFFSGWSELIYLLYFFSKMILSKHIFNIDWLNELISSSICAYLLLNIFSNMFFIKYQINLIIAAVCCGLCTFWIELVENKIWGISIAFAGMFAWQLAISIIINRSKSNGPGSP